MSDIISQNNPITVIIVRAGSIRFRIPLVLYTSWLQSIDILPCFWLSKCQFVRGYTDDRSIFAMQFKDFPW